MLRSEVYVFRIWRPGKSSYPLIEIGSEVFLLAGLAVVEHEAEAVALVSGTLLGAVGDVASIGGVERRRVAGGIIGGDVLGLWRQHGQAVSRDRTPGIDRNDPQVVVGRSRGIPVVIRRVANLLSVGGKGVVILPAEGEDR